ncbi:MAG TPA: anti-sigma factor [Terriglobales bacterium]|nr:anti-sigma factor [Terriglobales bacterium]
MPDAWTEKLDTYLDGELPSSEMSALDAHVRSCSDCAAEVLGRIQLKRAVQTAGKRFAPSADFRQRIQKMSAAKKPQRHWSWQMAATAAVFLVVLGVSLVRVKHENYARQIYSEIADLHVSTLASASPVDVISTDRHTVKPWFEGKIPFSFNLPELQNSEFSLIGGRVTYLEQTPGAQLIYHIRKHQISVLIFPETSTLPSDSGVSRHSTFEMQTWTQSGLRFFVIGDAPAADVSKLADMFKNAETQQ